VVADDDCFIAVGYGPTVARSCDGKVWTRDDVAGSESLYGVAVGDEQMVAVGSSGVVLVNRGEDRWKELGSGVCLDLPCRLESIAFDAGLYAVAGAEWSPQGPLVAVSRDAEHWTVFRPQSGGWLHRVTVSGDLITAVGSDRTILRSECLPMLVRLEAAVPELAQGERSELVLTVSESLRRDIVVDLVTTDPAAVELPDRVTIPAWMDSVAIPIAAVELAEAVRIVATLPEEHGGGSAVVEVAVGYRNPAPRRPARRLP
jgi:hypothetical protein